MTADEIAIYAGAAGAGVLLGVLVTWLWRLIRGRQQDGKSTATLAQAKQEAERILKEAELNGQRQILTQREEFDRQCDTQRQDLKDQERRLARREDSLDRKVEVIDQKEHLLETQEKTVLQRQQALEESRQEMERKAREREAEIDQMKETLAQNLREQQSALARIAKLTEAQAREELLNKVRENIRDEEENLWQKMNTRLEDRYEETARWTISQAIARCASEHTTEHTTSAIDIPSDDVKGRVIGREGRNIRAFEKATGVDVIVDDTPGIIVVSAFDTVRREIARRAMEKLIVDGRIHPGRIESVVEGTRKDIEKEITERGKQVQFETGVHGVHPKIQYLLGRLMYRTSYGQNVLLHSIECGHLCGLMAGELGYDDEGIKLAKRCGLLHDIGKALDHDQEGGHPELGMEFARKFNEPDEVCEAIGFHHNTAEATHIFTILAAAADAISASRPGARRESLDRYVKRLARLEEVATSHDGVDHAYAIQAGREIRVIVDQARVDDNGAAKIARDIARSIEEELTYPGEIRVTIIRETRVVEVAR